MENRRRRFPSATGEGNKEQHNRDVMRRTSHGAAPSSEHSRATAGSSAKRSVSRVVPAHIDDLCHLAEPIDTRDVSDDVNGERDSLADAAMRKADVRGQHAVRQASERLLGGVRVNRAQAPEMTGVQRLEEVERFGAAHLAHQDAIRAVTQRGAQEVGDGDRRERAPPVRAVLALAALPGGPRSVCRDGSRRFPR